jgi:hypothetical protein
MYFKPPWLNFERVENIGVMIAFGAVHAGGDVAVIIPVVGAVAMKLFY